MLDDVVDALRRHGIHHLVSVANGESAPLYFRLRDDPEFTVVDACREGEAVAIACGLNLGGRRALVSMENFGVYESLDTLRAMPVDMGLPIPLLIGYTARPKDGQREAQEGMFGNIASQALLGGAWTEPVLEAVGIPFRLISTADPSEVTVAALDAAFSAASPSALLVERLVA
jgi:sulfopyruvate decarboxylase TPP-binding subunit